MLHEFLSSNREELISRCKAKLGKRLTPTAQLRQHGISVFLTHVTEILREESIRSNAGTAPEPADRTNPDFDGTGKGPYSPGIDALFDRPSVHHVVHYYGDVRQAVAELAMEQKAQITIGEFQTLNRCLDEAIAGAVSAFAREHERDLVVLTEHTMNERLGVLAHEFRNLLNTAILAVDAIKRGNVGIAGSTGAILDRSLNGLHKLCVRTLVDVRLEAGIPQQRERVLVAEFIEEVQVSSAIEAEARGILLVVDDVESGLVIDVDRQILAGAVANLLQNGFKFTKPQGRVSLRAFRSRDRVLIEVEDECGGLPTGDTEDLFLHFEQRNNDRSGLGLGLGISRRGVEANGGTLNVSNLPGTGCVFTIDLPYPVRATSVRSRIA